MGGLLKHVLVDYSVQEESEEFLSLEDDEPVEVKAVPTRQKKSKNPTPNQEVIPESTPVEAELIDMEVLGEYGGTQNVIAFWRAFFRLINQ